MPRKKIVLMLILVVFFVCRTTMGYYKFTTIFANSYGFSFFSYLYHDYLHIVALRHTNYGKHT